MNKHKLAHKEGLLTIAIFSRLLEHCVKPSLPAVENLTGRLGGRPQVGSSFNPAGDRRTALAPSWALMLLKATSLRLSDT
jgi:hypothetical protein